MKITIRYLSILIFVFFIISCGKTIQGNSSKNVVKSIIAKAVKVQTNPEGGVVRILELNKEFKSGDIVELLPGEYNVIVKLKDSGEFHKIINVTPEMNKLKINLFEKTVVKFSSEIKGIDVFLSNNFLGRTPLEPIELEKGDYSLKFAKEGFFGKTQTLKIKDEKELIVKIALEKKPTYAIININSFPQFNELYINEEKVNLKDNVLKLNFGTYHILGIKQIDDFRRIIGEKDVFINKFTDINIDLPLNIQQIYYANKWLDKDVAQSLESKRYSLLKTKHPIQINCYLTKSLFRKLSKDVNLYKELNKVLRIGDKIVFIYGNNKWIIQKRFKELTNYFKYSVKKFQKGQKFEFIWIKDRTDNIYDLKTARNVSDLALFLYLKISDYPMLYLNKNLLNDKNQVIYRNKNDGYITIIFDGGENIRINNKKLLTNDYFSFLKMRHSDSLINIQWSKKPERLLVVASNKIHTQFKVPSNRLQLLEKKIVDLMPNYKVFKIIRYTFSDKGLWSKKVLKSPPYLSEQIDLTKDEIGPHSDKGQYSRIWIVIYGQGKKLSQRQFKYNYAVGGKVKVFESDIFLRRINHKF
jgi:hypothetical protein